RAEASDIIGGIAVSVPVEQRPQHPAEATLLRLLGSAAEDVEETATPARRRRLGAAERAHDQRREQLEQLGNRTEVESARLTDLALDGTSLAAQDVAEDAGPVEGLASATPEKGPQVVQHTPVVIAVESGQQTGGARRALS